MRSNPSALKSVRTADDAALCAIRGSIRTTAVKRNRRN
jgi:hypothetical protein